MKTKLEGKEDTRRGERKEDRGSMGDKEGERYGGQLQVRGQEGRE